MSDHGGGRLGASGLSRVPWLLIVAGLVVLVAGRLAARRALPEWAPLPRLDASVVDRLDDAVRSIDGRLVRPRPALEGGLGESDRYERPFRVLGAAGADYLRRTGGAIRHRVDAVLDVPHAGSGRVEFGLAPDGAVREVEWFPGGLVALGAVDEKVRLARAAVGDRLEALVLKGAVPVGEEVALTSGNVTVAIKFLPSVPGEPAEAILRTQPPNGVSISRDVVDPEMALRLSPDRALQKALTRLLPAALSVLLVVVLFGVLLFRRRLGFRIAFAIAALATVTSLPVAFLSPGVAGFKLVGLLFAIPYLAVSWAVGESLFRDNTPGFTTSLDALAAGRLGPRGGRALLAGLGAGAALAGAKLLALSAAAASVGKGLSPLRASFGLPFFSVTHNPFYEGPAEAGTLILFVALFRYVLPRLWADLAGAAVFALAMSTVAPVAPFGAGLLHALLLGVGLLLVLRRWGFASLLVAATSAALLRDALAAGLFLPATTLPALLAAGSLAAIAALGFAGVRRSEREDEGRVEAPDYVKRIESERRVRFEMDLLARMQLALLPEKPPQVGGVDLAVKTVLATEVGGDLYEFVEDGDASLWVAAGDVSGHGYSCGIQGAMVKAALLSLAREGRSPGAVLAEIDAVLRRAGRTRLFTSMALLKLDPRTGKGLLANAGHPFPLLLSEGRCTEIEIPGLPLGQGPPREYADVPVALAEGATLVLASDGLFEGTDRFDDPYGYDRPRSVLGSVGLWRRPAEAIVEALVADWRLHVGEGAPPDDTTVVAVKRPSLSW